MRASEVKLDATATLLEALVSRMPKSAERGGGRKKTNRYVLLSYLRSDKIRLILSYLRSDKIR